MIEVIPTVEDVVTFWKSCREKNAVWDTDHGYPWEEEEMEMIRFLRAVSSGSSDWLVFMSNSTIADTYRDPVDPKTHIAYSPINFMTHFSLDVQSKFNEPEFMKTKEQLGVDSVLDLTITEYVCFQAFRAEEDHHKQDKIGRIPASITIPYLKIKPLNQCEDWLTKRGIEARNNYVRSYFNENKGLSMTKSSIPPLMLHRLENICNPYHWITIDSASTLERRLVKEKRLSPREAVKPAQASLGI